MVLDVKQLYRKIIDDPDVVVDNNTSKEQLAMDMATQRAVQHDRNMQANSLGSSVSKLLQFLEKAEDDDEDTGHGRAGSDDTEEIVDLTDRVEDAHKIISELENPNVEHSENILRDLGEMGVEIGDAESVLATYKDMKPSDYADDDAYTDGREEAWGDFLTELKSTYAAEVDISDIDSSKFENLGWDKAPAEETSEEEVDTALGEKPVERADEPAEVVSPNTSVWEGHPVMEARGGISEGDVGKSIIAVQMTPAVATRHKAATGRAKDAIRKEAQNNAEKHFKNWYKKEFGRTPTSSDTPIFTAHENRGASTATLPWRGITAAQLQDRAKARIVEEATEAEGGTAPAADPADVAADEPAVEEADAAEAAEDAVEDDKDTDHIFHDGNYSPKDKEHINHIREIDEAHNGIFSEALQKLKGDKENPKTGNPAVSVFRTDVRGGAKKGSINIASARRWFRQQGGDLQKNEGKLTLPPSGAPVPTGSSADTWTDKVENTISKEKSSWDARKFWTGVHKEVRRLNLDEGYVGRGQLPTETAKRMEQIGNSMLQAEAEKLGVDISRHGEPPALEDIKANPVESNAEMLIRRHRSRTSSDTETGAAINEGHREVLRGIATDNSITDEERAKQHDEAQSVMERLAARLGLGTSSGIDTSQTSEEAVGEHTGRHIDTTQGTSEITEGEGLTQTERLMRQLTEARESEGRRHTGEHEFTSPDDKALAQVGEPQNVMGKAGKVAHTVTGTDDNPVHYVLTEHEDGSGSFNMVNALTGETIPGSVKHFPTGRAGGFERATNEYNELLTHDESETPLKGYAPAATEGEGAAEPAPPITGTRRPGDPQSGFKGMPRSRPGTTPGTGTPTEPPKEEERTGSLEGQAQLPGFGEDEEEGGGQEGGGEEEGAEESAAPKLRKLWQLDAGEETYAGGMEKVKEHYKNKQERKGGLCYECAHIAAKMNEDLGAKFTQGEINLTKLTGEQGRSGHAWVEIGDRVYDPSNDEEMSKDDYYKMLKPDKIQQVTPEQAEQLYKTVGPLGPYSTEEISAVGGEEGTGGGDGGDDDGGAGTGGTEDEGGGEDDDKTPPIEGVKGKGGQYRFGAGKTEEGGMPVSRRGTRAGKGKPVEQPEDDTRRGVDVAAEAKGLAPERGEQSDQFEELKRQKATVSTTRTLGEREAGDEKKSALLDSADRAGIFEYLSDKNPFSHTSPQEARENLAELDIATLKTTLDKHHENARTHLLSKEPAAAPVKKDRKKLEEHLAKVRGTTADDEFRENHQYHTTEELEAEIKATVKANIATQKNTETADAAREQSDKQAQRIQSASSAAQTMQVLPEGTGPIQAQQRMREIFNLMHEHSKGLPEKARVRLNDLSQDAIKNGADIEALKKEALERIKENKGWDDEWVAAGAARAEQDQAEHDEYQQHVTGAGGHGRRSEAFDRSGAGMMVQTDEEGNITGATQTAAEFGSPKKGKTWRWNRDGGHDNADGSLKHHSGHDESGNPKMFGASEPPKILGQSPEQQEAQKAHHEAVQSGDTAAQQRIEAEDGNAHLAGTGKSETELEEERIASCKPPGPPPPSKNRLEWNCNTHRWCNPDTVRGIQESLKDGEVAVMPNGIHAGTDDAHLDDPNNLSTHSAGGHRGNMNIDGTHQTGAVVISQHGTHAATTPAGAATAETVGPMGHKATASGAMGAAVDSHMKENPDSYTATDGSNLNQVRVRNAHAEGSHFANTGLFGSKTHASTPKAGVLGRINPLNIFRQNRESGGTPLTKNIIISKAIKPKKKATSKDILFKSGRLSHDSKQNIKEQIKNAQILRELEGYAYGSQKKQ